MTLETFLEKLEQTPRDWSVKPDGMRNIIRRGFGNGCFERCPITALVERGAMSSEYPDVGKELGLDESIMHHIAEAADGFETCDRELRAKLLKACGLESA